MKNMKNKLQCAIHDVIHSFIYGRTLSQRKNDLIVKHGKEAVNKAEVATSRYVGAVTAKILFSKQFEASCYAAKNSV